MKHAMFLLFGLCAAGCGAQGSPNVGDVVEARHVPSESDSAYCVYQMPDGSLISYDRFGECPATRTEVVEE